MNNYLYEDDESTCRYIVIHWTYYLFSDRLKVYSEFSKSASVTSSTWRNFKIVSRTLKVTGNRVMYDRGAWILRVIMLSSHALWCLLSVKKQKHNFHIFSLMYNISKVFFFHWMYIISICKCYQPQRSALADNPYLNLNNSWYRKNLIQ